MQSPCRIKRITLDVEVYNVIAEKDACQIWQRTTYTQVLEGWEFTTAPNHRKYTINDVVFGDGTGVCLYMKKNSFCLLILKSVFISIFVFLFVGITSCSKEKNTGFLKELEKKAVANNISHVDYAANKVYASPVTPNSVKNLVNINTERSITLLSPLETSEVTEENVLLFDEDIHGYVQGFSVVQPFERDISNNSDFRLVGDILTIDYSGRLSPNTSIAMYKSVKWYISVNRDKSKGEYSVIGSSDLTRWEQSSVSSPCPILLFERNNGVYALAGRKVWNVSEIDKPLLIKELDESIMKPDLPRRVGESRDEDIIYSFNIDDYLVTHVYRIFEDGPCWKFITINLDDFSYKEATAGEVDIVPCNYKAVKRDDGWKVYYIGREPADGILVLDPLAEDGPVIIERLPGIKIPLLDSLSRNGAVGIERLPEVDISPIIEEYEDYTYEIRDKEITITKYRGDASSIEIPNKINGLLVTTIGKNAFASCRTLKEITIPDSITFIDEYSFSYCDSLSSIRIPNSVTSIGECAFHSCKALSEITISNSVSSIGDKAFSWCQSLSSITIPNSVTSIGYQAFYGCKSLRSIIIPNSIHSIGDEAFLECGALRSIDVSVPSMDEETLYKSESLSEIPISNSVVSIGDYAFSECRSLDSVTIPDSITAIGNGAFSGCSSLRSITIPNSVTFIGSDVFPRPEDLVIIVDDENGYPYKFAIKNGYCVEIQKP